GETYLYLLQVSRTSIALWTCGFGHAPHEFSPVDFMPSYLLRLSTVVTAYQSKFPSINVEQVHLLGQEAITQPHAETNRSTDSIAGSDNSSDTDTESDSSSSLSDAPLDPCEPPLTKMPRGRPKKKRMRKYEAHRQRNKRVKEGREEALNRAPRRFVVARTAIMRVLAHAHICRETT
ncbi:hypothetical protein FN846DRAFT_992422, partial [Sphaerosporella brunnea]